MAARRNTKNADAKRSTGKGKGPGSRKAAQKTPQYTFAATKLITSLFDSVGIRYVVNDYDFAADSETILTVLPLVSGDMLGVAFGIRDDDRVTMLVDSLVEGITAARRMRMLEACNMLNRESMLFTYFIDDDAVHASYMIPSIQDSEAGIAAVAQVIMPMFIFSSLSLSMSKEFLDNALHTDTGLDALFDQAADTMDRVMDGGEDADWDDEDDENRGDEDGETPSDGALPLDHFPDPAFRDAIARKADTDHDGFLDKDEIAAFTELDAAGQGIEDVEGLSWLTALTRLNLADNSMEEIRLFPRSPLTSLDVHGNKLRLLDAGFYINPNLTAIDASDNRLGTLRIRCCDNLESLNVSGNRLASIDVRGKAHLTTLNVAGNKLKTLNIKENPELTTLDASGNKLQVLDISHNPHLAALRLAGNPLEFLTIAPGMDFDAICPDLTAEEKSAVTIRVASPQE